MKRFIFLVFVLITGTAAFAQNGFDYHTWSVGAGLGTTTAYGNTDTKVAKAAFNLNVNYNATPFFTYTLESQFGQLAGGSPYDYYQRQFTNTYFSIYLHADMQLGELIDYNRDQLSNGLKNVYVGTGVGAIFNLINQIQLGIPAGLSNGVDDTYPFLPASINFVIPLRTGYEFKIFNNYDMPRYRVDVGYSFNTAFGKGLDGYTSLSAIKFYSYVSLTFKVGLGNITNYRKPIPYYGY